MSHVLYYIPQGELWQNNHFGLLVNVLDNSPQGNTLYDNMLVWASQSEMSQRRLVLLTSCCTLLSLELCTNKVGFPHLSWPSWVQKNNQTWKYIQKVWLNSYVQVWFWRFLEAKNSRRMPVSNPGCHLTTLVTLFACFVHIAPNELHKRIIYRKTLLGRCPACVCVCCICLPLLGSPTQTNHCFTIILHVLTRVSASVCAC